MNRKLLDPFKSVALPEVIEEYFDYGVAQCCSFNRQGTLLATGTDDGYIGIWDFETRGLAKVLSGHSEAGDDDEAGVAPRRQSPAVTSLAWSRNGRYLLSGSMDRRIILWEVMTGQQLSEVSLPSGVTRVSLSSRKPFTAVVSLASAAPMVVDLNIKQAAPLVSIDLRALSGSSGAQQQHVKFEPLPAVAVLSKSGSEVFVGQQIKGIITVYDTTSRKVLDVVKMPAAVKVTSMSLNRQGTVLLINCSDKVLRMADVRPRQQGTQELSSQEVEARLSQVEVGRVDSLILGEPNSIVSLSPISFKNVVENNQWRCSVASQDGEHVAGAVANKNDHRVYIWNRLTGKLERILDGPRNEGIIDMAWHPCRSVLITVSTNGKVYIWAKICNEDWSAFAPDFKELDENQEYVEGEDEFDLNRKPSPLRHAPDSEGEEEEVDIITREELLLFSSDAEDDGSEEPLLWLPAEVEGPVAEAVEGGKEATTDQQQSMSADASDDEGGTADANGKAGYAAGDMGLNDDGSPDQPRERKRRVRFEHLSEADDDAAFEELLKQEQDAPRYQAGAGKARGAGRKGRPPRARLPGEMDGMGGGMGLPAPGNVLGWGPRGAGAGGPQRLGPTAAPLPPPAAVAAAAQGSGSGWERPDVREFGGSGSLLNPNEPEPEGVPYINTLGLPPGGPYMWNKQ